MLNSLRKASSGLVAKIMLGILALSFAVWGATDIFSGSSGNVLSKVGDIEITANQFSSRFQRDLILSNRQDKSQTKALSDGFALRIFRTMESEAALDNQLRDLNISLSTEQIAREIVNHPAFQDLSGKFDRLKFDQYLRASGLTEQGFLQTERRLQTRAWLQTLAANNTPVSQTMADAQATYQYQKRVAKYFALPESAIGKIEIKDDSELKKVYEDNKNRFTLPETRKVTFLILEPKTIQSSIEIDEAQLQAEYKRNLKRYQTPETRRIEQIPFSDEKSAQKAYEKLRSGASFSTIANEQGFESQDVELGTVKKDDIADQVIASAAFALQKDEISKPVKGQLSHMILRVTEITPGKTTPFEKVKTEIKKRLQFDQAQEQVQNRHDDIEDARGEGMTFEEIAQKFGMELKLVESVDKRGYSAEGAKASLPKNASHKLLTGIFESDVGLENDPVSTESDGYIWYEIVDVKKSRLKNFEQSKEDVTKLALTIKKQKALRDKAAELVKQADGAEKSLKALAKKVGAQIKTSRAITRFETGDVFSSFTNGILFATPKGEIGWAPGISHVIILKTEKIIDPNLKQDSAEVRAIKNRLNQQLQSDIGNAYISDLVRKYPIERNTALWQNIQNGSFSRLR